MKNCLKNKFKLLILIIAIIILIIFLIVLNGCQVNQLFSSFSPSESISSEIEKIQLDENELKSFEITNATIEEKIDSSNEIKVSSEKIRDPFMPFYLNPEAGSETQKNKLSVEKIYNEDEVFFTEINLNDSVYKLKKEDLFGKIYQVKAINADSVVLLKGDELITIYINEIYYD